jgi:TonB family protein
LKMQIAFALAVSLLIAWPTCVQNSVVPNAVSNFDAALGQLVFQIAGALQKERVTRVIVADLADQTGKSHPVGRFLADRVSAILLRDYPRLDTISVPHSEAVLDDSDTRDGKSFPNTRKWAKNLGAKAVIIGTFAKAPEGMDIWLAAVKTGSGQTYAQTKGVVPISVEIDAMLGEPIPAPRTRIAKAGIGGVTVPVCIYCPGPQYTDKAKAAKYEGTVILQVVITTDGRAANISVIKGVAMDLDEAAIEAVRGWKFRPAIGPNGRAVATLVPIEVKFRLR